MNNRQLPSFESKISEKKAWKEEERIKRFEGIKDYFMTWLVMIFFRAVSIMCFSEDPEYLKKIYILVPVVIVMDCLIIKLSSYLMKTETKSWLKKLDIPISIVAYILVLAACMVVASIKDDYIRGSSMMYIIVIILYFGQFILRSLILLLMALICFLIIYIFKFPHQSTSQLFECLTRLIAVFALVSICIYRFLRESKNNFHLRYKLKLNNDLIYKFMNSMNDAVIIFSNRGIQYQNPTSMERPLGIDEKNYMTKCGAIMKANNTKVSLLDVIMNYLRQEREFQELYRDEEFMFDEPMAEKQSLLNITLLETGDIEGNRSIGIVVKDITEQRKQSEKAIGEKYKSKIMNSFSHEIRTPLNGILGMIQISKERIQDEETRMHLGLAESSGFFLKNQLADFEDCGHIVAGKFSLRDHSDVCFPQLFQELEKAVLPQLTSKPQISFKISQGKDFPQQLRGDKDRLCQILSNFLSNALKYTQKGEICLKSIVLFNKSKIRLGVKDTGPGIPPSILNNLFELVGKSSSSLLKTSKLIGMGLHISQMIAREIGTKICVKSKENLGSIFYFDLNLPPSMSENISSRSLLPHPTSTTPNILRRVGDSDSPPPISSFEDRASLPHISFPQGVENVRRELINYKSKFILIVDDALTNRFVIRGLLRQYKGLIATKEAADGNQAVQMTKAAIAHGYKDLLIFMDLDMPIMNGYEAIFHIRQLKESRSIKIIVVSAFTSESERTECRKLDIQNFLPKPVTKDMIIMAVYEHLLKQ